MPLGIYLHIPFCLRKCAYCDFASVPLEEAGGLSFARRYLEALLVELDRRAFSEEFRGAIVDTIYVGGGTPTALPPAWIGEVLARLRGRFQVSEDAEVTLEANPGTVDEQALAALLAAGVNRLSLGVQSFSDDHLQTLGRIHNAADAVNAIATARGVGYQNLSLDLIYALPGQTLPDWQRELNHAREFQPDHLSAYALSVEPDTPLAARITQGGLPSPDEDLAADMFNLAHELLTAAGYEHYEISNFAKPHQRCRHNRKYWTYDEYLGLGASACSFRGRVRWNNSPAINVYLQQLAQGAMPVIRAEALSAVVSAGEMIMLGLRTSDGVSLADIATRCGVDPRVTYAEVMEELTQGGRLVMDGDRLRLPAQQWVLSNETLARFIAC